MFKRRIVFLALAVLAAACVRPDRTHERPPLRPNWMLDVPYIAQSQLVDTTGTPEVEHIVIVSPATMDSVATFYRNRLPPMGWSLLGDQHDASGVSLYFERAGGPMWVRITAEGPRSRVSFTAAGAAPPAAPPPAAR
jgi:hypothetical protein